MKKKILDSVCTSLDRSDSERGEDAKGLQMKAIKKDRKDLQLKESACFLPFLLFRDIGEK